MNELSEQYKTIGARVTAKLFDAINRDMDEKNYTTHSEYVRAAIREKLEEKRQ